MRRLLEDGARRGIFRVESAPPADADEVVSYAL